MLSTSLSFTIYTTTRTLQPTVADFLICARGVWHLLLCVYKSVSIYWTLVNPGCSYFVWFTTLGMPSSSFLCVANCHWPIHQHELLHVIYTGRCGERFLLGRRGKLVQRHGRQSGVCRDTLHPWVPGMGQDGQLPLVIIWLCKLFLFCATVV